MDDQTFQYWLEELKESNFRIRHLDEMFFDVVKFYFFTVFALITSLLTLFQIQSFGFDQTISFANIILIPLFAFGVALHRSLRKSIVERDQLETTASQIREAFVYGEVKNEYSLLRTPLTPFYSLISWMVTINFFAGIYVWLPETINKRVGLLAFAAFAVFFGLIIVSVVLASLNSARRKARDARRRSDVQQLRLALELHRDDHGSYPETKKMRDLYKDLKEYLSSPPVDPINNDKYKYEYSSKEGENYRIEYTLEEGGKQVVSSED